MAEPVPEMVERGSQALYESVLDMGIYPEAEEWSVAPRGAKAEYHKHFRAVLEAIREPTKAMVAAGNKNWLISKNTLHARDPSIVNIWQAMIDAALGKHHNLP